MSHVTTGSLVRQRIRFHRERREPGGNGKGLKCRLPEPHKVVDPVTDNRCSLYFFLRNYRQTPTSKAKTWVGRQTLEVILGRDHKLAVELPVVADLAATKRAK